MQQKNKTFIGVGKYIHERKLMYKRVEEKVL